MSHFHTKSPIGSFPCASYDNMSKAWRRSLESVYRRGPTEEEQQALTAIRMANMTPEERARYMERKATRRARRFAQA